MITKMVAVLLLCLFYWLCCFFGTGTDKKNLAGLRSYPDAVQAAVRANPALGKNASKEKPLLSILLGNLMLFTVAFSILGLVLKKVLGLTDFRSAFVFFLALGEGLGLFDLVIIDLLWWRNTKRTRFSFLPEKALYQAPDKHIASFLRGIPLFAAAALLSAGILSLLG